MAAPGAKCFQCGAEFVAGDSFVTVLGNEYHVDHIKCAECGRGFDDGEFVPHDGKPMHRECSEALLLPKCALCLRPMKKYWEHKGKHICDSCYTVKIQQSCAACNKKVTVWFEPSSGTGTYCESCFNARFAFECKTCGEPIKDKTYQFAGASYHEHCLRCAICRSKLDPSKFYPKHNVPLCSLACLYGADLLHQRVTFEESPAEMFGLTRSDSSQMDVTLERKGQLIDVAQANRSKTVILDGAVRQTDERTLLVDAHVTVKPGIEKRTSVDLALVIDVSHSMSGVPIETVKATMIELIRQMAATDRLAIITFSDMATTVFELQFMEEDAKKSALSKVEEIKVKNNTNISAGLTRGIEVLQENPAPVKPGVDRVRFRTVYLFTDGYPNDGAKTAEAISAKLPASSSHLDSVQINTFGFPRDADGKYTEDSSRVPLDVEMLRMLAVMHGGQFRFVQPGHASSIAANILTQWGLSTTVVANNVKLRFEATNNVVLSDAFGFREGFHAIEFDISSMSKDERKSFAVAVTRKDPKKDGRVVIRVSFDDLTHYRGQRQGQACAVKIGSHEVAERSVAADLDVSRLRTAYALNRAIGLQLTGQAQQARDLLQSMIAELQVRHAAHPAPGCHGACDAMLRDLNACLGEDGFLAQAPFNPYGYGPMTNIADSHERQTGTEFVAPRPALKRTPSGRSTNADGDAEPSYMTPAQLDQLEHAKRFKENLRMWMKRDDSIRAAEANQVGLARSLSRRSGMSMAQAIASPGVVLKEPAPRSSSRSSRHRSSSGSGGSRHHHRRRRSSSGSKKT